MARSLAQRHRAKTKAELERALKARDRQKLKELREAIAAARRARRAKLRDVTSRCKRARQRNIEKAKRQRQKLRESIQRTREKARGLCLVARGETQASTLREIERAVAALQLERTTQRQLAVWLRPTSCALPRGARAKERRQESDCEVAANIDDPGLRVVWERVKRQIKGSARRSRTEAFLEWAHDHSADVYRIQEEDAERALRALELEERRLAREAKKPARYRGKTPKELATLLADVPF